MDNEKRISEIEKRLFEIKTEKNELIKEIETLRKKSKTTFPNLFGKPISLTPTTPRDKIKLFIELFVCRKDVYPIYWENLQKGIKGYSPVCNNQWKSGICNKPKIKCSNCDNKNFDILDEEVIKNHLQGKILIGSYSINKNDECRFLVADFDRSTWQEDILAYKKAARELGVEVSIERSKSGNGGHAWIFFSENVPAKYARSLGMIIMSRSSSERYTLSLDSYDRFFPSQDLLPKGGFGSLIALPLYKKSRDSNNSVFVDSEFNVYHDQWDFLSNCNCLSLFELNSLLNKELPEEDSPYIESFDDLDIKTAEKEIDSGSHKLIPDSFTGTITIKQNSALEINIKELPSTVTYSLKRTATFANPKFFELQKLRLTTWKIPRYIFCGEVSGDKLLLPRGTLDQCLQIINTVGANVVIEDNRYIPIKFKTKFTGELYKEQNDTVSKILKFDNGVLVAPPGSGKTVMACYIISRRKVPTLILVNRSPLIEQWKSQLEKLLGLDKKEIGIIGGNRKKITEKIDIAMLQTITNFEPNSEFFKQYGQIIVDECHHIPAFSFESVLKQFNSKYVLGLTATPYRKDGHQPILFMQCGPIRYEMYDYNKVNLTKYLIVKETSFQLKNDSIQTPIHEVWEQLINDENRLNLIADNITDALNKKGFPLIISERKDHLTNIFNILETKANKNNKGFLITGELSKKSREKIFKEITELSETENKPYILATGSLIGEGFDLPALDTLFITMPVSFKGKLIQYAGRLHREYKNKKNVTIYDYFDNCSGLTVSMYRKRLITYKKMGYAIQTSL